jgi:AAA+ superfamily predicted ATPase
VDRLVIWIQFMPTSRQLVALFRAIAGHDTDAASRLATQICAAEEEKGHRMAARLLRSALHQNGSVSRNSDVGFRSNASNGVQIASAALVRLPNDTALANVVLSSAARRELDIVIREWTRRTQLLARGLLPRSKLLFHGPPGCGKSLTARALGHEFGIPVYLVRFDAVIGAYLGQTAIHLRQLFSFAETTPCVLLLDELDALGKQRGNPLDVGELDRIVIALMQELEHSQPRGLIIGTSNLPRHLDSALWRRFDLSLEFKAPTPSALVAFAKRIAKEKGIELPKVVRGQLHKTRSFARAESVVIAEARRQALIES